MSCVRPRAPAGLVAFALKFDSWRIRPRRRAGSTLYFAAAASISAAYGVFAPLAPVAPVTPVAPLAPVALGVAVAPAVSDGSVVAAAGGGAARVGGAAGAGPAPDARCAAKLLLPAGVVPVAVCGVPTGAPAGDRPSM